MAAIAKALKLIFPFEKYTKLHIKCARIIEHTLLNCSSEQDIRKIQKTYKAYKFIRS